MSRRRVVITGIGPITCVGHGRENFWKGILAEMSGIKSIASFDPSAFRVRCAGEIRDWDPEEFFEPHRLKRLDRYAQFAVASAKLALDDAKFEYSREKPLQGRRSIHPVFEKGRSRSSTHARCPGFWWVSPFEHRD